MSTLTVLRESVETKSTVWIGYVDNHGATVERLVEPVKVEGGWLTAYDRRSDEVRSFAVHRIIGVSGVSVDDPVDDTPRTRRSSG
jgi:predicted DNA-binding transcriptional regulator YafY